MKTEKNNKLRGTVLFTVVAVMALLIIFLTGTLALATASSNRAHKSYSSSQASYTAKTAILGFTQAMRSNSEISDKIISLGVGTNPSVIHPTVSFKNGSNEDKSMGLVGFWGDDGKWHNNQITIEREMMLDAENASVPKTQWDYDEDTNQWIQTERVKITATARVAKEESTVTAYLTKKAPSKIPGKKSGSGGIKGLNTVGDGVFENGGRYTGGIGLGLSKSGMKMVNGNPERIQYRLNNAVELDTTLSFINADIALMTGNFSINVCQAAEKPVSQTIINGSLWTKNDTLVELDYQMNSDFTQKEVPYLYVNGAMCFDSQGEIVRYRGETKGNYKHESQPASPYNVFVGTISAKSNNFILHGDLYLMDEYNSNKKYMVKGESDIVTDYNGNQGITYGDNIFGQTNSSQLYKWTSDTLNKTNSQHESFGGNIYCNGNLTLGGGTFDGDIKVKGDLTIKDTTIVHGDVVVGGKLKVLNNGNNDKFTVDGTVYATNPDGYRAPGDTSDNTPETYRSYPNFYEGPEELKDLSRDQYPSNYLIVDFDERKVFEWRPQDHKDNGGTPTDIKGNANNDWNTEYFKWKNDYATEMTLMKRKDVSSEELTENDLVAVYNVVGLAEDKLLAINDDLIDKDQYEEVEKVDTVIEQLKATDSIMRTPEQNYVINNFIDVESMKHEWDVGEKSYYVLKKVVNKTEDGTPIFRSSSERVDSTFAIYNTDTDELDFNATS